ncbi:vWA domain-containing protein [Coralliovum pocilloporae]|uniref:vWA domain-containing protein n=1 Tax=Coralliovum pocilloporae TaxID=3066369 RepID=UPI0033072F3A
MAHLRGNGFEVGLQEVALSLHGLPELTCSSTDMVKTGLKAICCGNSDEFNRFDDLFDAYWRRRGTTRVEHKPTPPRPSKPSEHPALKSWADNAKDQQSGIAYEADTSTDSDSQEDTSNATGKLIAAKQQSKMTADLRKLVTPEDMAEAEDIAEDFARQCRYRRSRRTKISQHGHQADLRRTIRASLASGGEPVHLFRKTHKNKPSHLVVLLDASGSMTGYARVFLAFLKGLIGADQRADAYLFHTRLIRISDALRDKDSLRAINRLSLMAEGFGSGTRIGHSLHQFNTGYASRMVNGRSTVLIVSDGYDTGAPEQIGQNLKRLKKRGCRIIWVNPLQSWKDSDVITRGIEAARPYLHHLSPAATLQDLATLGRDLT